MTTPRIRPAVPTDVEAICSLVHGERFQEDGSGALLPVRAEQVRTLLKQPELGSFFVAANQHGGLAGCVSVVVYGLPQDYEAAMVRLRKRIAAGALKAQPRAGWTVLVEGEAGSGTVAELRSLVVSGAERGKGLGGDLIEVAKADARSRGFGELYSLVNENAVALFERSGFQRAERTPQKLVVDCATCPILERCNEVPVVAKLGKSPSHPLG